MGVAAVVEVLEPSAFPRLHTWAKNFKDVAVIKESVPINYLIKLIFLKKLDMRGKKKVYDVPKMIKFITFDSSWILFSLRLDFFRIKEFNFFFIFNLITRRTMINKLNL
jgi:hypothetical protein